MRRRMISLALLFLLLLTASCGTGSAPQETTEQPAPQETTDQPGPDSSGAEKIEFTDALGQTFSVDRPRRVVAMIGSFADIWCLAGGESTLAATANDAWESFGLELPEVENIGSGMKPSVELVLAAEPDLVLASSISPSNLELKETLDQAGIPAAYFDVASFQDYLALLELCTRLTGQPERYAQYGTAVEAQVDAVLAETAERSFSPSVLTIQVSGSSVRVKNSEDNVLGPMLKDLGCINIADRDGSLLEDLNLEAILQADPDYIFAVYHGTDEAGAQANLEQTLLSNPAWASLRAVQEDRFYVLERRMFNLKPNALWGDAYEKLAGILYGA